ncbi:sensor histidine kinase [Microbacterium sp. GXF6406]
MGTDSATGIARRLRAVDRAVDIGFAILLVVCGIRYFSRHPLEGVGIAALVLAIGAGVSYAVAVIGKRASDASTGLDVIVSRQGLGLLLATGFWLPLVVLAPSFGWCGFALFFAVHRVIRGRLALVISAVIVVAVSAGLFLMSNGDDLGLVLGPFFGGLILASAYASLDRALDEQRMLIDQLVETRAQLARSERDAGALAERERVASELHDTVVQRTATALLMLESDGLRPGEQSAAVSGARDALREGLIETRRLLHGLADPRTDVVSLTAALRAQSADAGAEFSVSGVERDVPEKVLHALQRVVQEALTNASKHARAASIHVTLTFFDEEVGVDIADDGIGFDADDRTSRTEPEGPQSGGFGIRAMRWRIESLGGALTIESYAGEGAVIAAVIPTTGGEQ